MLQELITVRMGEKLTAVPLITSIRASPTSSASKFGGDTLSIATLKLCGATLTCIDVNKNRKQYVILNDLMASTAVCLLYTSMQGSISQYITPTLQVESQFTE